ncbi:kinase domain protein (macronuclear) [Tetrahymena thermophila SB210]|uniref:Kinase domain protein n=1 Tax=Tetrahymena thermophila (strain SB210) TaxID=312017 RepID=Q23VY1_TETTS|nr:kinase domain protein [Tetrahymena thermophila SB210]EAS00724.2 kinase domain protein [Tetrahymena thermophila SB210]|eukprot:XP_001020969.2 kinase domain protein [Tetrahymena thermophila SB210]
MLKIQGKIKQRQKNMEKQNIKSQKQVLRSLEELKNSDLVNLFEVKISLRNQKIGVFIINKLVSYLQQCKNVKVISLDLAHNQIELQAAIYLASSLKQLTNLTSFSLDISENNLKSDGLCFILDSLCQSNLEKLKLKLNNTCIEDQVVPVITQLFNQKLKKLQIDLGRNKINGQGICDLVSAFQICVNLEELSLVLDLDFRGDLIAKTLGLEIKKLENLKKMQLSLCRFSLDGSFIKDLNPIFEQKTQLKQFEINLKTNYLKDEQVIGFFKQLELCKNLESLSINVGYNRLKGNTVECIGSILTQLYHLNYLSLNFDENQINGECVKSFATSLLQCKQILFISLVLPVKQIDLEQAEYLKLKLKKLPKLVQLNYEVEDYDPCY